MNNPNNYPQQQPYNAQRPFEVDQQITAMKEDVATRTRNLKIKKTLVSGGMLVVGGGLLAAALFFPPAAGVVSSIGPVGKVLVGAGFLAAGGIADILFSKEIKKLEMDEQFLEARLQGEVGNRYWQHYHGHAQQQGTSAGFDPGLQGAPPPNQGNNQGM